MRYNSLVLIMAPLFALACQDSTVGPETSITKDPAVFDFANAPDVSGIVTRSSSWRAPTVVTWTDPMVGLRVTMGASMDEFCDGTPDYDIIQWQDVNLQNGRINLLARGDDTETIVWGFTSFDCALFTAAEPLASGYSDVIYTDNDYTAIMDAAAWGIRAHGVLARPSGATAVFSAHVNLRWNASTGLTANSRIQLN